MPDNLYDETLAQLPPAPSTTSKYDEVLKELDAGRTQALRTSLVQADTVPPDRAVEVQRLSQRTGLAADIVDRNLEDIRKRARLTETPYRSIMRETPHLATWATKPENAAVAHDDLDNLGALEWLFTAPQRAFAQQINQLRYSELRFREINGTTLTQDERDRMQTYKLHSTMGGELGAGGEGRWFRKGILGAEQLAAQAVEPVRFGFAGALEVGAAGAVAGSILPGVGTLAGGLAGAGYGAKAGLTYGVFKTTMQQEAVQAYDELADLKDETGRPMDPDVARIGALVVGGINAGIEEFGLEAFLKSVPGLDKLTGVALRRGIAQVIRTPTIRAAFKDLAVRYGSVLTSEVSQEVAQRAVAIAGEELGKYASGQKLEQRTPADVARELGQELGGAVGSFWLGLLPGPVFGLSREIAKARAATHNVEFFKTIGEGVTATKTFTRMPEAAQDFIHQVTQDGPIATVFAPVDTWQTYWQGKGLDPAVVAEHVTGSADAYARAIATGEDLAIPTARYATILAGTEHNGFFSSELRLGPDEMNGREAEAFVAQAEGQTTPATPEAQSAEVQAIHTAVLAQLERAGVPAATATHYAALYEAALGSLAQRAGLDPVALYESYGLKIERPSLTETPAAPAVPVSEAPAAPAPVQEAIPLEAGVPPPEPPGFRPGMSVVERAAILRKENPNIERQAAAASARAAAAKAEQPAIRAEYLGHGPDGPLYNVFGTKAGGPTTVSAAGLEKLGIAIPDTPADTGERLNGEELRARALAAKAEVDKNSAAAQTSGEFLNVGTTTAPATGSELSNRPGEQPGVDQGGVGEGPGNGRGAEPGRLPTPRPAELDEVFKRQPADVNAARLTPEVTRELERILEELRTFPFVERTWNWITHGPKTGNAAGGAADIVEGAAGAVVYNDVLYFAPVNERTLKGEKVPAKNVHGTRGDVQAAIAKVLASQDIHNNLAEGAVRVAENRAAGNYTELNAPELPPTWGTIAPVEFTDALSDAIDQATTPAADLLQAESATTETLEPEGAADTSFNVEEFNQSLFDDLEAPDPTVDKLVTGEEQPRLPGDVGAVREQDVQTPAFEAPFALEQQVAKPRGKQTTLFQQTVYHGTAHEFERFSLQAIGSGQGAQSYGWGLYFTSLKAIATQYREQLAGKQKGKHLTFTAPTEGEYKDVLSGDIFSQEGLYYSTSIANRHGLTELYSRLQFMPPGKEGMAKLRSELERTLANYARLEAENASRGENQPMRTMTLSGDPDVDRNHRAGAQFALDALNEFGAALEIRPPITPGRTYTVDIPEDEDFLFWDKPASQQSAKVQAALTALGVKWEPFKLKTLGQMRAWLNGPAADKLAREDIGIRESLREAAHFADQGDETALKNWQGLHQGFFRSGMVDPTGESIYEHLKATAHDRSRKEFEAQYGFQSAFLRTTGPEARARSASEALAAQGVAGIRYLDGFSRAAGEGTSNYVVFDDKLAQIREFDQSAVQLTPEIVASWADEVRQRVGPELEVFSVGLTNQGDLKLNMFAVARGVRRAGLGSTVMQELARFADLNGKRIVLNVAGKDDAWGTTSRERLVKFYKRFGFVENKGRNTDFTLSASMYREPTLPAAGVAGEAPSGYGKVALEGYETPDLSRATGEADLAGEPPAGGGHLLAGTFGTRTQLVTAATRTLGASKVLTPQDAATATAYLARGAQERFDALLTDAAGTPLAIVGSFKGNINSTAIHPEIVLAEAIRVPGATAIWFAHNHPSGEADLSPDDRLLAMKMADTFRDTGIDVKGLLAIGAGQEGKRHYQLIDPAGATAEGFAQSTDQAGVDVPVLEREFSATGKIGPPIGTSERALEIVPQLAGDQFGAVLMDTKHVPIGFIPMDPQAAGALREDGRLAALYRAISIGAPATAIVYAPEVADGPAAANLANALHANSIHVLDIIGKNDHDQLISQKASGTLSLAKQFQQGGGERRGAIRFGPDRQFNIALLERADLSTFLHESGHFFLEVFTDVANQVGALDQAARSPEQQHMLADHAALMEWLKDEDHAGPGFSTKQHEQFARGFEAYLMEGKAPSVPLQTAFARFRAWLVGIYRSLAGLRVNLTDDVRTVMDRLLASDLAIADVQAQRGIEPMFTTAESAGMSESEFALYRRTVADASKTAREQLDRKLLEEVQREQRAAWRAQKDDLRESISSEVEQKPVYRALAAITKGEHPNGEPLVEGLETPPLSLSKALINERYGPDRIKRLPRGVTAREGGMDPNTVAELFGFSSGDELLTAIENAAPMKAVIEQEVKRRMLEEHGSMLLDGTIHEKAQAAVANEDRDTIIRAEMRALGRLQRTVAPFVKAERKAGQAAVASVEQHVKDLKAQARGGAARINAAIPPAAALRDIARERLSRMRIRDIDPKVYWSASRRAGHKALEHAARQEFFEAINAKQQELINLQLYRQAELALEDVEKGTAFARSLASPGVRKSLGLAGANYLDQVDGILDRFEFARVPEKVLERRASIADFAAGLEAQGLPVDLPASVLDESRRKNYRELPLEEFRGVTDGLRQLVHLARLKNRLLKAADAREFAIVRDALVDSIRDHNAPRPKTLEFRPADEKWRSVSNWFASHRKLSDLAQSLDGYVDGGAFWDAFMRPLNAAGDLEQIRKGEAGAKYRAILERAYPGRELATLNAQLAIPAIGGSLSKEARLAVALNWGNETSRDRILSDKTRGWKQGQVDAILDTLDKRDWDFVQATWDLINSYWPEIAEKQERVIGVAPEKVEALPVKTKFGDYAGGYYPLVYDGRLSIRAGQNEAASQAKLSTAAAYVRSTTKRGHVETRLAHVSLPVRLELSVAFAHFEQVIHDLTHHEALIDVTRLIRDPKISQAILDTRGDIVYKQFATGLQDIAIGSTPAARDVLDRAANFMRTGTQIAGLGWNLWTGAQQPLGLFNGMARVGPQWIARGLARWLRDAASMENTTKWIADLSPMMRDRSNSATQDLHDLRAAFAQPGGWFDNLLRRLSNDAVTKQTITDSFLWHIGLMQRVADVPTWIGQYEKSMAGGETEARAIALADQAVLDSQGGGQVKDLAQIQRGGPVARLFMTFYSYGNTVFNATARATGRTSFRSPADIGRMLGELSLIYIMPAVATVTLATALGRRGGDDDSLADFFGDVAQETLATALNTMVLVRELGGLARDGVRGYSGPAGTRALELLYNLGQQIEQGKVDEGLLKALNAAAGVLFRYPAAQVQRTIDGIAALVEGKAENPGVVLVGAQPKKK